MELISQGAEAKLYRDGNELVKDRVPKGYRLPELDARIRKTRTRGEAKMLDFAARSGINVPRVLGTGESTLRMEYIDGRKVKDALNAVGEKERGRICTLIGEALARLHSCGIAHGDFTTSNMILVGDFGEGGTGKRTGVGTHETGDGVPSVGDAMKLYVIDFGLSKMSKKPEDQAVDMYLLFEALKAAHFEYLNRSWQYILKSYIAKNKDSQAVVERFKKIELRRRYKGE